MGHLRKTRRNLIAGLPSRRGATEYNTVFLIFDIWQSNSVGRATSQRLIQLTEEKEVPDGVKIFFKPDYAVTDNGAFETIQEGSTNTREPDQAAVSYSGSYGMLAARLKRLTPDNTVYVCMMGDGGTALKQNLTSPDWAPTSSGECFQIATEYYYAQAYADVQTAEPGKTIIPIIMLHGGETDATDNTATSEFAVNFPVLITALRASHASLTNALLIITKIYYLLTANETTINAVFQAYADANSSLVKIVDISDINRKVDLTVPEQGGVATAGADDEHTSYLGQRAKADRAYTHIKAKYAPGVDDSEYEDYVFDVSTISPNGIWLPFSRDNVTIGTNSTITGVINKLDTGVFSSITGSPKFKTGRRRGCISHLASSTNRINTSAAIGTTLINGSFSFSFFIKPRDGRPAANQYILHDIQNTGAANNSRVAFLLETTGKIQAFIAISGTAVTGQTANAIFTDSNQTEEKHIAVTFTNGGLIRIYVDGVLQTLDATNSGNIAALDLTAYLNDTNAFTVNARKTGAGTWDSNYIGGMRHLTCQPVVYSLADISNLMRN
jgi:hypothetical protein